ncbi:MAG: hypothetical protein LBT33_03230 [Spirochaetia bacterium]|nr:hypothetical protein [Spirochaetia bacterium]
MADARTGPSPGVFLREKNAHRKTLAIFRFTGKERDEETGVSIIFNTPSAMVEFLKENPSGIGFNISLDNIGIGSSAVSLVADAFGVTKTVNVATKISYVTAGNDGMQALLHPNADTISDVIISGIGFIPGGGTPVVAYRHAVTENKISFAGDGPR